jgi:hypothetical protein
MIPNRDNLPRILIKNNIYAILDGFTAASAGVGELLVQHHPLEGKCRQSCQHQK